MTKVRIAVLGTGSRAMDHLVTLSRLRDHVELVGVCDVNAERVASVGAQYDVPSFEDLARMLADARPELLYVIIPPDGHRAAVELAAQHGVHVISETPIAPTLPLADAMIVAAREHGIKLEVAENVWRWPNELLKAAIVRAGLIGEVTQVHLWYQSGSYHGMSTTRKIVGSEPVRARGFARKTPVPPRVDRRQRLVTAAPYELGLVEFASGAICVYQYPLHHYRGNYWDVIGSAGAIVGTDLVLQRGGERQVFPIRQVVDTSGDLPSLEKVFVETDPPIVWENPWRDLPIGANADEVARADICLRMCRAIREGGDPAYGAVNARTDQELLIAIRESALRDGEWVGLPLTEVTETERRLHDDYRRRYDHDPLGPAADAVRTFYPNVTPAEMALVPREGKEQGISHQ